MTARHVLAGPYSNLGDLAIPVAIRMVHLAAARASHAKLCTDLSLTLSLIQARLVMCGSVWSASGAAWS